MPPGPRTSDLAAPPAAALPGVPPPRAFSRMARWLFEGPGYRTVGLTVDACLLAAVLVIADSLHPAPAERLVLLASPAAIVLMASRRLYDPHARIGRLDLAAAVAGSVAIAAVAVAALVQLARPSHTASGLIAIQFGLGVSLLILWRTAFATARDRARKAGICGRATLIVGAGETGARIERHLLRLREIGLIPVGFVDAHPIAADELEERRAPVLGSPAEFDAIADETGAEHAILAFQLDPDVTLRRLVRRCRERGLGVAIVPRLFDDATNRMELEHVGGIALFELRQVDPKGWQISVKHGLDRIASAALLVLLSPILVATAIAVAISLGRPLVFRQDRVGRDGQRFELLKFRSMRPAGDGDAPPAPSPVGLAPGGVEGADRRTRVGRFIRAWSLDELPQLLNVLRGQMSMIGPRPERPELAEGFGATVPRYDERLRMRSGITGWAQVNGLGPGRSLADKTEWDNWYIQNWSFWLDTKILLKTIPAVLTRSE